MPDAEPPVVDSAAVPPAAPDAPVVDELFAGRLPIQEALAQLRLRLLDLTSRNRLLNFKHSPGRSLQFVHSAPDEVVARLFGNQNTSVAVTPVPEPRREQWVRVNDRLTRPEVREHAKECGINPAYDLVPGADWDGGAVRALRYPDDLARHCRKLERGARSAIAETGANMLFLVVGFLEFPERADSDRLLLAPLISVPVALDKNRADRDTGHERFSLRYTGEDLAENLSLREKLAQEYNFELLEFDDEASPEHYFVELERLTKNKPRWKVKRQMTLALLSFSKMLLVRDIDPAKWPVAENGESTLVDHAIVRMVFEGAPHEGGATSPMASEYTIDGHALQHIPLIYDADSSQHSALIDALSGRNLVVEGPPGTGKSQTITNLIAAAMAEGKSVLFISEKMAALDVVQKRLNAAGLAPFCLELHSTKTQKKHVLDDLQKRRDMKFITPQKVTSNLQTLEEMRQQLAAYADLLNGVHGNVCGLTVHDVLWRAERFRQGCGEGWLAIQELVWPDAPVMDEAMFRSLSETLARVAELHGAIEVYGAEHPFWGLFVEELLPGTDLRIERTLRELLPQFEAMADALEEVAGFLGSGPLQASAETTSILLNLLATVAPADPHDAALELLPRLFPAADPQGLSASGVLREFGQRLAHATALRALIGERLLTPDAVSAADGRQADAVRATLADFGLQLCTTRQVQAVHNELAAAVAVASTAIPWLEAIGTATGHPFQGDSASIRKMLAVVGVAAAAPRDLLGYRHGGLGRPNTLTVISRAQAEFKRLVEETNALGELFYLDTVERDARIGTAISVLREGDTWYRVFQGRWRRACATHRALDRSKAKKTAAMRLSELERLHMLLRERQQWQETAEYRDALGPFFSTRDPQFEDALRLTRWHVDGIKNLVNAELDPQHAGVLEVDETRLVRLSGLQPRLGKAVNALQHLREVWEKRFAAAPAQRRTWSEAKSWRQRLGFAQAAEQQLAAAAARLSAWAAPTLAAETVLRAVQARVALSAVTASVNADGPTRALLGDRFLGADTAIEPILAALTYGRQVLKARLPDAITRALMSDAVFENHRTLSRLVGAIHRGWATVGQFAARMREFGRFDLAAWATGEVSSERFVANLRRRTEGALANRERLLPWAQYLQATARARERGLSAFVNLVEQQALGAVHLVNAFGYRFFGSIAHAIFTAHPTLARFAGVTHEQARWRYAALDREIIRLRGLECAHKASSRWAPASGQRSAIVGEKTEMELLNHMMAHPRARVTLRRMLLQAGGAVQALKPCFMMGPQAVAQYLEPNAVKFDIVVMDEASQLKPEEAIGAIARGKQLVVVGDPKQLPPTSFFDRLGTNVDDGEDGAQAAAVDSESILDVCMGHFRPVRTLRWHYRSRHESLIAFSNSRFYDNRLIVFPSPYKRSKRLGLRYRYVDGAVYEGQMNRLEAAQVVDAAIDHMVSHPEESLGIVTLNLRQRDLVEELLDERCGKLPKTEFFRSKWEEEGLGLFVKNLESVQGDERDVIFISTTFGRAPNTDVVRQNFGPISRHTGWRRLNVLFTRARRSVHVFTSMRPEDIVVDEKTPRGTRSLREYLEFARSGLLTEVVPTGNEAESDFELAVTEVLLQAGHTVVPQLGVAGYRIDMAVKHPAYPSAYLAAIECDGASYHSGVSVRDRDRIRQEILESLGWKDRIWRIWSTDWFRNPRHETKRLLEFLKALMGKPLDDAYLEVEAEVDVPRPSRPQPPPAESATHAGLDLTPSPAAPVTPVESSPSKQSLQQAEATVLLDEDEDKDRVIEVGDAVAFAPLSAPSQPLNVRIVSRQTDFEHGIIAETTPLAQTLLGAAVGDEVVLRVPGKPTQTFVVIKIVRPGSE